MKWRSVLAARLSACDGRRGHSSPLSVFLFPKSRAHFRLSTFYPLSRLLPILTLLALMLALAPASPAYASAIVVTGKGDTIANDGICTLREAINAANNDAVYFNCAAGSGPDTITFAAPYVITLGSALPPISPSTQLTITGKGASATIIQANAAPNVATYRLFYVTSSATLTLQDLTVRNGRCNGSCATFPNGDRHWSAMLRQAKDIGDVRIHACALSMELFGITKDDLDPLVDDVEGVASFMNDASAGPITFI